MLKHFFLQGDGGVKLVRYRCAYPSNIYQEQMKQVQKQMCPSAYRSLRCVESPQR